MHMKRFAFSAVIPLAALLLLSLSSAHAAEEGTFQYSFPERKIRIEIPPVDDAYFVLHQSTGLPFFDAIRFEFGSTGALWEFQADETQAFFTVTSVSIYAPTDSLRDGIDDLFKINQGLNPLDPAVAGSNSGFTGEGGLPLTWRQYYQQRFNRLPRLKEQWGRETSVFNFGIASARLEAFSPELSVMNGELPPSFIAEAYSRETSVFNFGRDSSNTDTLSRELTVFNFGEASAPQEALSREVAVYNGASLPVSAMQETYSRPVSVFNHGAALFAHDAVSREVSVQRIN